MRGDGGPQRFGLDVQRDTQKLCIGVIDDFAEFATVEPDAAAVRAEIDLHVMTGRETTRVEPSTGQYIRWSPSADRWSVEGLLRPFIGPVHPGRSRDDERTAREYSPSVGDTLPGGV